jgi:hypothetical protein
MPSQAHHGTAMPEPSARTLQPGTMIRVQCAAITNGCMSSLTIALDGTVQIDMDGVAAGDPQLARALIPNGWRLSYGRWVCPGHP